MLESLKLEAEALEIADTTLHEALGSKEVRKDDHISPLKMKTYKNLPIGFRLVKSWLHSEENKELAIEEGTKKSITVGKMAREALKAPPSIKFKKEKEVADRKFEKNEFTD